MYNSDITRKLMQVRSHRQLDRVIQAKIEDLGFDLYDFSSTPTENTTNFLTTSLPEGLVKTYIEEDFSTWDMFLDHLVTTEQPIFLSKQIEHFNRCEYTSHYYKKNRLIVELSRDYGLADSYSIPIFPRGRKKCVFSVVSTKYGGIEFERLVLEKRNEIISLGNSISHVFHKNFKRHPGFDDGVLTPREIDVLYSFAREVKTAQQAADYLNMSYSSVNKHIENIREALGAISTNNAIYLAMKKKLIE